MKKIFLVFLAGCVVLSGCSAVGISYRPAAQEKDLPDLSKGRMVLRAIRQRSPEKLARGYIFVVTKDGEPVATYTSAGEAGTFAGLAPGMYDILVSGKRIRAYRFQVEVRAGQTATVSFYPSMLRYATLGEDFVTVTGKAIFYAGLGILYVVFYLPIVALMETDVDNGDDLHLHAGDSRPSEPEPEAEAEKEPEEKPAPEPRVKPLLEGEGAR